MNYLLTKFTIISSEKLRKQLRNCTKYIGTSNHNKAIKVKGPLGPNVNEHIDYMYIHTYQ